MTVISLGAPDMVAGSEQQRFPVAAMSIWLWGLVSTGTFVWAMGKLPGNATRQPIWIGLTLVALVAPMAVTALTVLAGITAGVFFRPPDGPPTR